MDKKIFSIITLYILNITLSFSQSPTMEGLLSFFKGNVKTARTHYTLQSQTLGEGQPATTIPEQSSFFSFYPNMQIDSVEYKANVNQISEKYAPNGETLYKTHRMANDYSSERRKGDTLFISRRRNKTAIIFDAQGHAKESYTTNRFDMISNRTQRIDFDNGGHTDLSVDYNMQGDTTCIESTTYDANDKLIRKEKYCQGEETNEYAQYSYNEKGDLQQSIIRTLGKETTETYEFDAQGRKINHFVWDWEIFKNEAPVQTQFETFSYDKRGNMTSQIYNHLNKLIFEGTADPSGRWIKQTEYDFSGISHTTQCTYNSDGELVKRTESDGSGNIIAEYARTFQKDGSSSSTEVRKEQGTSKIVQTRQYDPWGNVTSQETISSISNHTNTEKIVIDYEYYNK